MLNKAEVSAETLDREIKGIEDRLELEKLDSALYFPQFFQIESVRYCNAKCPFCLNGKWDMSEPLMPEHLFDKILEELEGYTDWIRMVDVQRGGEPLLDKGLCHKIKRLKEIGVRFVNTSTNGSLLTEERAWKLLEAGLDEIHISMDSVDKATYEKLRVGLSFDKVVNNIKTFFRVRDAVKPDTIIRIRGVACFDTTSPKYQEEIMRWEEFWSKYRKPHDRVYMKRLHTWGNEHIWNKRLEGYEQGLNYAPCIVPWSTLHVTSMGIVPLCGMDNDAKANMGNVYQQTIAEIWRGEQFQRVRQLHINGLRNEISFCQGCRVFDPDFSLEKGKKRGFFSVKPETQ